jgi:hypothetical protein
MAAGSDLYGEAEIAGCWEESAVKGDPAAISSVSASSPSPVGRGAGVRACNSHQPSPSNSLSQEGEGERKAASIARLTYAEAERVIARLRGQRSQVGQDAYVPLRTLQYRRQKAGIQQMVQTAQLEKVAALATQRNWSPETLVNFCKRQCGHHPLRTTEDANKVIEALKAMNKREGLWAA